MAEEKRSPNEKSNEPDSRREFAEPSATERFDFANEFRVAPESNGGTELTRAAANDNASVEDEASRDRYADLRREAPGTVGRVNRRDPLPLEPEPKPWWVTSRRQIIIGGAATGALLLAGGTGIYLATRDDTTDVEQDSLALQKEQGWNVGSEDKPLNLTGARDTDSQGGTAWQGYLQPSALISAYNTKSETWMPFFVPTLMQSLQFDSLRNQMKPIETPDMREAYGRGQAIASDLLANSENPAETALVVDLPGRDAVAFAAGLADRARIVGLFDNIPHPLGVTPAHETLGAMLNYAAEIDRKQAALPADAPAVFLLDSNRLAPYTDEEAQFDNRFLARMPTAANLQERGVKSLLYVTPDGSRTEELDDLNEDFVAYKEAGVGVGLLPLSDFKLADNGSTGGSIDGEGERRYHYGGNPMFLPFFFYSYPFYRPYPAYGGGGGFANRAGAPSAPRYTPAPRQTLFSGRRVGNATAGVGRTKPTGFGRSTVRVNSSGSVVGTRAGRSGFYSPARSGSFGRSGGGYSG